MSGFTSFEPLLSNPKFAIFDFAPGETHSLSTEDAKKTARRLIEVLIVHCLDKLGFDSSYNPPIDRELHSDLASWAAESVIPLCGDDESKTRDVTAAIRNAAVVSDYLYPHADAESRMHMARVTLAGIALDDFAGHDEAGQFGSYVYDLLMGKDMAQDGGWLGMFTRVTRDYMAHFGEADPRAGALGGAVLFHYISSLETERRFGGSLDTVPPHLRPSAPSGIRENDTTRSSHGCCPKGFPRWHRAQSGGSAAYVAALFHRVPFDYWITGLAPLLRFTDLVNDLMSFSKELLGSTAGGEMDINYVTLQTLVRRQAGTPSRFGSSRRELWTYRDSLCEMMDEIVQAVCEADKAFVEYPRHCDEHQRHLWNMDQAARAWTSYKNGFVKMHIDAPRWGTEALRAAVRDKDAWAMLKGEIS
ncbi:hypothetical protein QBC43DRAFT_340386 [Cladorrhinum sp. PSN259]|nr:hypothetical protein QBC43DRAFT_340386 [Cladorrhinum sp. PSN259]